MQRGSFFFLFLCILVVTSCKTRDASEKTDLKDFFSNSKRRTPTTAESAGLALMLTPDKKQGSCSAFFARSTQNHIIVLSARHCLDAAAMKLDPSTWCASGGAVSDMSGNFYTCKNILAWHKNFDTFAFEVTSSTNRTPPGSFRLAAFFPSVLSRTQSLGFPVDSMRSGQPTMTENCWIVGAPGESPHISDLKLYDRAGFYNCTTYAGNSGGPVFIEGTDIAIGQPFVYHNENEMSSFKTFAVPENLAGRVTVIADFVKLNAKELSVKGVILADAAPSSVSTRSYLPVGGYASSEWQSCLIAAVPLYYSSETLQSIYLKFTSEIDKTCNGEDVLTCSDGKQCALNEQIKLQNITTDSFDYLMSEGKKFVFRLQ